MTHTPLLSLSNPSLTLSPHPHLTTLQDSLNESLNSCRAMRSALLSERLPNLEQQVRPLLEEKNDEQVTQVLSRFLEELDDEAFKQLRTKMMSLLHNGNGGAASAANGSNGGGGNGSAASGGGASSSEVAQLQQKLSQLQRDGGGLSAEKMSHQAEATRAETDRLRQELSQMEAAAAAEPERQPSAGRRAQGGGVAGTPLVARQSVVQGDSADSLASGGQRRVTAMSALAEDEMGQITPVGAAPRGSVVEQPAGA